MADDFNISPEMINNFMNILKNNNSNSDIPTHSNNVNSSTNTESNIDFNNLGNILSNFTSNLNNHNNDSDSNNTNSLDFETILKIKSIMESMNTKNDPRANLLYSLKPYLREERKDKLDQYANLLNVAKIADLLKNDNKENNNG